MAYDKEEIFNDAVDLSLTEGFFFVQDLIDYLRVSKSTFYEFFPDKSDELDELKRNLYNNRIQEKIKLRKKLGEGSGSELIALYKLLGTDEERKRLSTTYNDLTTQGEKLNTTTTVEFVNARKESEKKK